MGGGDGGCGRKWMVWDGGEGSRAMDWGEMTVLTVMVRGWYYSDGGSERDGDGVR